MAGKKGSKADARTPVRSNGVTERGSLDQARALTAQAGRAMLGLPSGLEPMATAEPSHAIQEQNLKAALDASSIFAETLESDGTAAIEEIEREVAFLSPYIQREVLHYGRGFNTANPIALPSKVTLEVLQLLLQYCRFHRASGRSDKERKMFDEKFVRLDTRRLCELTSAADALDMKPLVDLTSRALARLIEGKTPEQIRAQFQLPDDLTEEEKLEPVRNFGDDPKIRLLNRLYEKKRKELQRRREEEEKLKKGDQVLRLEGPPAPRGDDRSLDDLLSFIDGSGSGGTTKGSAKKKRSKSTRKQQPLATAAATNGHQQASSSVSIGNEAEGAPTESRQNGKTIAEILKPSQKSTGAFIPDQLQDALPDGAAAHTARKARQPESLAGSSAHETATAGPESSAGGAVDNSAEAFQPGSLVAGANPSLQKHRSEESAGLSSYTEGEEDDEDLEEGTLDDIDEDDDADASASWHVQREELLMHSASFGPILGPITTLTSLANFKARSLLTPRVTAESPTQRAESPPRPTACSTAPKQPTAEESHVASAAGAAPSGRCGSCVDGSNGMRAETVQSTGQTGVSAELPHSDDQDVSDAAPLIDSHATAADRNVAALQSSSSRTAAANGLPSGDPPARAAAAQLRRPPQLPGDYALGLAALLDSPPSTSRAGGTMSAHGSSREEPDQAAPDGDAPPGEGPAMLSGGGSEGDSGGPQQLPPREAVSAGDAKDGLPCNGVRETDALPPARLHQVWGDPADVAAAHGAMLAFLQRCGLARHLQLVPMKPGAEPPDQVPIPADQKVTLRGADDRVLEEAVLPNGAVLQLSLNFRSENLLKS
ncbi:g7824 [Coccomyxa elongata]